MSGQRTSPIIYTIGHSNHDIGNFIVLLQGAGITAVADVRSVPFSRYTSQFNRHELKAALAEVEIAYSFLGEELGARPKDSACYRSGTAVYDLIAQSAQFRHGLERVLKGSQQHCIALMCAEKDPLDCHRNILVARHLARLGACIHHIMADGTIEENAITERRLLKQTGEETGDLFAPPDSDPLGRAYTKRGNEIAYAEAVEERTSAA